MVRDGGLPAASRGSLEAGPHLVLPTKPREDPSLWHRAEWGPDSRLAGLRVGAAGCFQLLCFVLTCCSATGDYSGPCLYWGAASPPRPNARWTPPPHRLVQSSAGRCKF